MKVRNLLLEGLCILALSVQFTSCNDDDNNVWNDEGSTISLPQHRSFILNEGAYGDNNTKITFYAPNKDAEDKNNNLIPNFYFAQNKKGLGDTGQDIAEYDGNIYVIVYGSKLLLKLNAAGVEEKRLSFSEKDGSPRYMAIKDDKIYVTLYSGKVARIDANTLTVEKYVNVNSNPEQIVEAKGKLYVANSGWGKEKTISVINMESFTKEKDIQVIINPNYLLKANDEVYVISFGDYGEIPYTFQRIKADDSYENIAKASYFAEYNNTIYLVHSETNWATYSTVNKFFTYNSQTHQLNETSFLTNMPDELKSKLIRGINIDKKTGDIYILTANKTTNGDIYRFKNNGNFIEKFDCGGLNPSKIIWL